ncbi:MAG: CDC48 family AAA ATPase [Candidatus Heimdallarchaeota archaeon]|nr:CDC48 family AAA ATPase [Candidatus Heimdallarchaeota archaeon]
MSYKLKVDDANKRDVGRQIARIPSHIADKLGLRTGDIVQIEGKRITYAKVWRNNAGSGEKIQIEALTRKNLQVSLDEIVEISAAKPKMAETIDVQPVQHVSVTNDLVPFLSKSLMDKVMTKHDLISMNTGFSGSLFFKIQNTQPDGAVIFNAKSKLTINFDEKMAEVDEDIPKISYENIGGLGEPIRKIREMIELPLKYPEIFDHLGIRPPQGVLLYGPPGTGKTLLAKAIANETSSSFFKISGPEITSKYYGESESRLREIFDKAEQENPSIIFIDEIDSLVPKRDGPGHEAERRIVAQLLTLMDGINSRGNIVVIGATNRPNSIDEALRRGGRFDREIEIGIPDSEARLEILQIHTRGMPLQENVDLEILANRTHGFVGADLEILTKEAALHSLRRFLPALNLDDEISKVNLETLNTLDITMDDFERALTEVSPSALREVFIEVPNISWDDIGGLESIKEQLKEAVEWPIKYRDIFEHLEAKPPSGILLFGPPGTGKTMLAKAVANEAEANFISIKGPELLSKWVGDSEKGVREIFRKARSATPCIIFFDEMDSIASSRNSNSSEVIKRVVSQLLTEIDGLEEMKDVMILGATNRPDLIDAALLRPGRFDKSIFVGNPDYDSRVGILKVYLKEKFSETVDMEYIAEQTEGYSGAELSYVISHAKLIAIREFIKKDKGNNLGDLSIKRKHIDQALMEIKPNSSNYNLKPAGLSEITDIGFA